MKRLSAAILVGVSLVAGGVGWAWLNNRAEGGSGSPPRIIVDIAATFPDAIFFKETSEKVVALTIDDVPSRNDPDDAATQAILDAIAEHNAGIADPAAKVRATFFVISGQINDGSTILERMTAQGHEIANHGDIDGTAASLPPEAFETELRQSHERITTFTDQPIRWFRPGRGLFNHAMVEALRRMEGYEPRFALASMLPVDTFRPTDSPRFTAWYVGQHIFPGSILLLHGGTPQQSRHSAEALTVILAELQQRGYRVTTLSDLWDSK
jgi:peptidoglycan/xylan/chitin deacetylase (PgdA/CDA1 family)